mmetsp:Transcript_63485/g.138274  ORF Transcript_63485/g.138274 Transcript_63485/m.138274 type:complete len:319 (-) Transcript_63485:58-1014(-)
MLWESGCSPRVTVVGCSESLKGQIFWGKVATIASQVIWILVIGWKCRVQRHREGLNGWSHASIFLICLLGIVHSICLVAPWPESIEDQGPLFFNEFTFTLFNAALVAGLAFANRIWIEQYHAEAYPNLEKERATICRAANLGGWLLIGWIFLSALLCDVIIVIYMTPGALSASLEIQHWVFAVTCSLVGLTCQAATWNLLRRSHELNAAADNSDVVLRLKVARLLILTFWMVCIFFCLVCAILLEIEDVMSLEIVWLVHASFILMGGGGIASMLYMLLHQPSTFDSLACLVGRRTPSPKPAERPEQPAEEQPALSHGD